MSQVSTTTQKRVDQLLVLLIVAGIGLIWFSIFDAKWVEVAIGASLSGISYLLLITRIKKRVHAFSEKLMGQMEMIKDINSTGFKVYRLEDQSNSLYQWRDINQVVLKHETDLVFKFQNNDEKIFDNNAPGFYRLLKKIPADKLIDDNVKAYQRTTFENLKTCTICGYVAFKNSQCLNCRTDSFETAAEYVEEKNEAEYLKEEQLVYFCTDEKGESVKFYPKKEKDDIFEFDENWKPIVTESEVIEFSEENYWD